MEKSILFSGDMVQALLDGRKTQTRRVVKPQPGPHAFEADAEPGFVRFGYDFFDGDPADNNVDQAYECVKCPFGRPGDRLWVRETFSRIKFAGGYNYVYRATDPNPTRLWKPSIHMPRVASRLTLEITEVRVERLQDISEEDAFQELGVVHAFHPAAIMGPIRPLRDLWDSLYAKKHPWDSNPWVWVVSFRRVKE